MTDRRNWKQPTINSFIKHHTEGTPMEFVIDFNRGDVQITIDDEDLTDFTASLENIGTIGSLELLYDESNGTYWINHIEIDERTRRRGVATLLLQAAIDAHGTIYASLQAAEADTDVDTRHLTDEGNALVTRCMNRGMQIVKALPGDVGEQPMDDDDD